PFRCANVSRVPRADALAALGGDLMLSLIPRNIPKSLWGQTAVMFIVLAVVLAVLQAFTFEHYFMGAVTVRYGFVIGWFAGWMEATAGAPMSKSRIIGSPPG